VQDDQENRIVHQRKTAGGGGGSGKMDTPSQEVPGICDTQENREIGIRD
jgi:hypothetical protein